MFSALEPLEPWSLGALGALEPWSLGALDSIKLNLMVILERSVTGAIDSAVVGKDVRRAVIRGNETKARLCFESINCACSYDYIHALIPHPPLGH